MRIYLAVMLNKSYLIFGDLKSNKVFNQIENLHLQSNFFGKFALLANFLFIYSASLCIVDTRLKQSRSKAIGLLIDQSQVK